MRHRAAQPDPETMAGSCAREAGPRPAGPGRAVMKARVGDQLRREAQAEFIRDKIAARLAECGLELHPVKTRIVYCKDSGRSGSFEREQLTFPGVHVPAAAGQEQGWAFLCQLLARGQPEYADPDSTRDPGWRIHRRSDTTFAEVIAFVNTHVAGWAAHYGRVYKLEVRAVCRLPWTLTQRVSHAVGGAEVA
jgi:hypothetical protein